MWYFWKNDDLVVFIFYQYDKRDLGFNFIELLIIWGLWGATPVLAPVFQNEQLLRHFRAFWGATTLNRSG